MLAIDHTLVEELEDQTYTCHHPKRARARARAFGITRHPADIKSGYEQRISPVYCDHLSDGAIDPYASL
jgi:hypothetical protein